MFDMFPHLERYSSLGGWFGRWRMPAQPTVAHKLTNLVTLNPDLAIKLLRNLLVFKSYRTFTSHMEKGWHNCKQAQEEALVAINRLALPSQIQSGPSALPTHHEVVCLVRNASYFCQSKLTVDFVSFLQRLAIAKPEIYKAATLPSRFFVVACKLPDPQLVRTSLIKSPAILQRANRPLLMCHCVEGDEHVLFKLAQHKHGGLGTKRIIPSNCWVYNHDDKLKMLTLQLWEVSIHNLYANRRLLSRYTHLVFTQEFLLIAEFGEYLDSLEAIEYYYPPITLLLDLTTPLGKKLNQLFKAYFNVVNTRQLNSYYIKRASLTDETRKQLGDLFANNILELTNHTIGRYSIGIKMLKNWQGYLSVHKQVKEPLRRPRAANPLIERRLNREKPATYTFARATKLASSKLMAHNFKKMPASQLAKDAIKSK